MSISKKKEKRLLYGLINDQSLAFEELYKAYSPRIYNFVYSVLFNKSLAEDITQDCFIRIWERRKDLDLSKSFSSYIYTIARNLVYRETEKQVHDAQYIKFIKTFDQQETNEDVINLKLMTDHINQLINELPEVRKEIFTLSRFKGLSAQEIANKLSLSERTVETQIYRSLLFLKKRLKNY